MSHMCYHNFIQMPASNLFTFTSDIIIIIIIIRRLSFIPVISKYVTFTIIWQRDCVTCYEWIEMLEREKYQFFLNNLLKWKLRVVFTFLLSHFYFFFRWKWNNNIGQCIMWRQTIERDRDRKLILTMLRNMSFLLNNSDYLWK